MLVQDSGFQDGVNRRLRVLWLTSSKRIQLTKQRIDRKVTKPDTKGIAHIRISMIVYEYKELNRQRYF